MNNTQRSFNYFWSYKIYSMTYTRNDLGFMCFTVEQHIELNLTNHRTFFFQTFCHTSPQQPC